MRKKLTPKQKKHPMESPCSFIKQRYAYLVRMIANTRKTGHEHAYSICISPQGNSYVTGECSGNRCSVHPIPCPKDSVRSINHTHPGPGEDVDNFSIADFYSGIAVESPFDCLYSTADHRGKCVVYKPFLTIDEMEFLQGCRKIEKGVRSRGVGGKGTRGQEGFSNSEFQRGQEGKLLKECYAKIPDMVGESVCEYGLKSRAKWTKRRGK